MSKTAAEYRAAAEQNFQNEADSFDRCDTDGFLSQWASNITGRLNMRKAEIAEKGGRIEFDALFNAVTGELVAAKEVDTKFGRSWMLLESDDPQSRCVGWFNPSKARKNETRKANNRKKGYTIGTVLAPAAATIMGGGTGLAGAASAYVGCYRTDGGFSRDVEIVEREWTCAE